MAHNAHLRAFLLDRISNLVLISGSADCRKSHLVGCSKDPCHSTRNAFGQTIQRSGWLLGGRIQWQQYSIAEYPCRTECQRNLQTSKSAATNVECHLYHTVPQPRSILLREHWAFLLRKQTIQWSRRTHRYGGSSDSPDEDEGPRIEAFGTITNCPPFSVPPALLFCGLHRKCLLRYTRLINSSFLA